MDRCIVITGASAGIGLATARAVIERGVRVANLDRAPLELEGATTFLVDLFDHASLTQALGKISKTFEVVGLVNNAGYARTSTLEETSDDTLLRTFDMNLRCAAQCARELVPAMRERSFGRIVNISSRSALGRGLRTAYAASKGGLISMTRVWALELGPHGITSNCVAPGPIATELFDGMNPEGTDRRRRMLEEIPVGRLGAPEDVARAVCFFLAPENSYINGQTLYVCGGLSCGVAMI